MKVKIRNGTKHIAIGFFVMLIALLLSTNNSYAATGKVTFYLNGGTIPGFSNIDVRTLDVGVPFVIPSNPIKPGYDFMGWVQHGAGGIGPQGSLKNTQDPIYGGNGSFGTDAVSKPVSEVGNTGAFVPNIYTSFLIPRPADCEIPLLGERSSTNTVARVRFTGNAKEYGQQQRLLAIYNGTNRTWLPKTVYRFVTYVKIPKGYSLAHVWYNMNVTNAVHTGLNKPTGGIDAFDVVGNGEYQYIEGLWYSGDGMTYNYAPAFVFYKNDLSLPDPSPSNPIDFDFGYLSYSIADGSLGTSLQKDFKGQNTYTSNGGWDGLTAIYEPSTYTITYDANGGSGVFTNSLYRYNTASSISLSSVAPTRQGYTFLGWSTDKNATTSQYAPGQVYACSNIGNKTLYAVWKFTAGGTISLPKTLIVDAKTGKCTFKISSTLTSGSIVLTIPDSISISSTKGTKVGTISMPSKTLTPSVRTLVGTITFQGLTAGSWSTSFNIKCTYVP